MGSKLVVNRQKSSEAVRTVGQGYLEKIEIEIGNLLGAESGEAAAKMVRASLDRLAALTDAMVTADDRHFNEISDDNLTLATRDEAVAAVRASLIDIREICDAVYGPAYVQKLGFDGKMPSDAMKLMRLGSQVERNLDAVPKPETARRYGVTVDPVALKEKLTRRVDALSIALAAVRDDVRQADLNLVEKRDAIDAYDDGFAATADLISTLLRMAGEQELAKRVRPSTHRLGLTMDDASDPAELPEIASEEFEMGVA